MKSEAFLLPSCVLVCMSTRNPFINMNSGNDIFLEYIEKPHILRHFSKRLHRVTKMWHKHANKLNKNIYRLHSPSDRCFEEIQVKTDVLRPPVLNFWEAMLHAKCPLNGSYVLSHYKRAGKT